MSLMLILTLFILHITAYKHSLYHDFTFKLLSKPEFYSNLDQFDEIKNTEIKFHNKGRKSTSPIHLTIDDYYEYLPDHKDKIGQYSKARDELLSLLNEKKAISNRLSAIKGTNDQDESDTDDTDDENEENIDIKDRECIDKVDINDITNCTYDQLRERAIKLRHKLSMKRSECNILRSRLNDLYYSIPFNKLGEVPENYPSLLNYYSYVVYKNSMNPNSYKSPIKLNDSSFHKNNDLLTHDKILKMFNYYWQRNQSRMLLTLGGPLSILENALIRYLLWVNTFIFGFTPFSLPYMSSRSVLNGTGHLPKFRDNLFSVDSNQKYDMFLIPTGEVPLAGMFRNQSLRSKDLPLKLMSYTQCFRNEKVGYGTESKGLLRQHQFGKVELLVVTDKQSSSFWHSLLVSQVEYILRSLSLSYMTELVPVSDTPLSSAMTVDVKVFFPARKEYVELSSISNTMDYQSKMLNVTVDGHKGGCHILNASGEYISKI